MNNRILGPVSSQPIVAHLVHGTWPRGLDPWLPSRVRRRMPAHVTWYDEGSDFRRDLSQLVGRQLSFEAFEWSGSNSITARKKASEALKRHLVDAGCRHPDARHVVIAHSHGGNVALEAFRDQHISGMITMGTPFLHTRPCSPTRAEVWLLDRALIGGLRLPLLLGILALFWYRSTQDHASESVMLIFYALLLAWLLTLFSGTFMDQVRRDLGLTSFVSKSPLEDVFNSPIGKRLSAELEAPEPESPSKPCFPLLVLRAEGDEAARALGMARTAAQAWAVLWRVVPPIARLVAPAISLILRVPSSLRQIFALPVYASVILLNLALMSEPQRYLCYFLLAVSVMWWESIIGLIAAPLLFGTSAFYALGFGWEMVYTAHLFEIRATSMPVGPVCECVTLQGLQAGPGHLRHSLHEFAQVRRLIALWIKDGELGKS